MPVDRWGGNTTETYNWQLGSSNLGSDWYFENASDCWAPAYNYCSGMSKNTVFAYRNFIAKDRQLGAKTLITLPMAGYVAKNAPVTQPLTCGYPKSLWPSQDSFDPYDPSCGNGQSGGKTIPGKPTLDGVASNASYDSAWVSSLVKQYGPASSTGVGFYELGNEPSLWSDTHSDIHPKPETASELWQKSEALATAVKTADPSAKVLGFSEWGWPGVLLQRRRHARQRLRSERLHDVAGLRESWAPADGRVVAPAVRALRRGDEGAPPRLPRRPLLHPGRKFP